MVTLKLHQTVKLVLSLKKTQVPIILVEVIIVIETLSSLIGIQTEKLDYVYFSGCQGAEPHTDLLDPSKFTNTTYVIPVILPLGDSLLQQKLKVKS